MWKIVVCGLIGAAIGYYTAELWHKKDWGYWSGVIVSVGVSTILAMVFLFLVQ